jgi:hypothetical protein
MILCIDPGNDTGWCILRRNGMLHDFGLGDFGLPPYLDTIVVEVPKIRPGGPHESIVTLAMTAGRLVQAVRSRLPVPPIAYGVFPETWKGQVPKHVHNKRVLDKLSAPERQALTMKGIPAHKENNVIDAIGIALWVKDRMSSLDRAINYRFDAVAWAI